MVTKSSDASDPFDHGVCSLSYKPVSKDVRAEVEAILKKGWGINEPVAIQVFDRPSPYSQNFSIRKSDARIVLRVCKTLGVNAQRVIDDCKEYASSCGLPIPRQWQTLQNCSFFLDDGKLHSLCDFIEGKHFSGSTKQLQQAARLQAEFHKVFLSYPERENVEAITGDVYPLDDSKWEMLKEAAGQSRNEFDERALEWMGQVDAADQIYTADFGALERQLGHFDWHPHNLIFDSSDVIGLLDFDLIRVSERARDVAIGMHKFARVFGSKTEEKLEIGSTLEARCVQYLESYQKVSPLRREEILLMPDLLYDEVKRKLIYLFSRHYFEDNCSSDYDLEKHVVQLNELGRIAESMRGYV